MGRKCAMSSEEDTQNRCRVNIGGWNGFLWRNNSGVHQVIGKDGKTSRVIRYGLANDSAPRNKEYKSTDLIGFVPRIIMPEDVGKTIAQFLAFEIKKPGWHMVPSDIHAAAQWEYMKDVGAGGGIASFITHPDQLEGLLHDIRP